MMKGLGAKLALLLVVLNLVVLAAGLGLAHMSQTPRLVPGYNADKIILARSPADVLPGTGNGGRMTPVRKTDAPQPAGPEDAAAPTDASRTTPAQAACLVLPDYGQSAHDRLLAELEAAGIGPGRYAIRLGKNLGWWVYVPPESSAAKREAVIALLKAAEVKDMAVIGRGSMTNAISLGMFAQAEQAAAHLKTIRGKGMERAIYGPRPDVGGARVDLSGLSGAEMARLPARLKAALTACPPG